MRIITKDFFATTSIPQNKDTEKAMDFLAHPKNIEKMISATENGKPALSAVVADLEELFGNCEGFPLNHDAKDSNAQNRRNVGWMVRYIMREYGYIPIEDSGKTRIGIKSGAKYFQFAALYKKSENPARRTFTRVYHSPYNWKGNSMFVSEDTDDYTSLKEQVSRTFNAMEVLNISRKRVLEHMEETGYGEYSRDLVRIFKEEKIPCIEVLEDIDETVQLFIFADVKNKAMFNEIKEGIMELKLKVLKKAGMFNPTVEDVKRFEECDFLTKNGGRDNNTYFWYYDGDEEAAICIETGKFLTKEQIEDILM